MNVEIGTKAAQFLFWKCIIGIFVAVQFSIYWSSVFSRGIIPKIQIGGEEEEEDGEYEDFPAEVSPSYRFHRVFLF